MTPQRTEAPTKRAPATKTCKACQQRKPLDAFRPHNLTADGRTKICKACIPVKQPTGRITPDSPSKVCPRCKVDKPRDAYGPNLARFDKLQTYCRACFRDYRAESAVRLVAGVELADVPRLKTQAAQLAADQEALFAMLAELEVERDDSVRKLLITQAENEGLRERVRRLESQLADANDGPAVDAPKDLVDQVRDGLALLVAHGHPDPAWAAREVIRVLDEKAPTDAGVRRRLAIDLFKLHAEPTMAGVLRESSVLNRWGRNVWKADIGDKHRVVFDLRGPRLEVVELALRKEVYAGRGRN